MVGSGRVKSALVSVIVNNDTIFGTAKWIFMLRIILIMPVAHFIGLVAVAQPAAQKSGDLQLDGRVLAGSRWAARVAEDCSDSLVFLSGHRVSEYSCEAGEW